MADDSADPKATPSAASHARSSERVTINKEFASFDAFLEEYVTNISRSGVFIKSKTPLPVGTLVNLRFTVIMDDIETVEGTGEVVRVDENPAGMGILFRDISAYSKGIIERLLVGRKLALGAPVAEDSAQGERRGRTAAALIIGNELLSGKVREGNLHALARLLRSLGVELRRVVMVLDQVDTIAAEVRSLSASHDYLFTSGGVGPTHDDVTMEAIARAFGVPICADPALLAVIHHFYGENVNAGHLRMALVPQGAEQHATVDVPWPVTSMRNVWILPGVPEAFRMKLPLVSRVLGEDRPFLSKAVFTAMDEGTLKPLLDKVVAAYPSIEVGSYPTWSDPSYATKLTFDSRDGAKLGEAVAAFVATLPPGEPQRIE